MGCRTFIEGYGGWFGDIGGGIVPAPYLDWIGDTTGLAIPEPSAQWLLLVGLVLLRCLSAERLSGFVRNTEIRCGMRSLLE